MSSQEILHYLLKLIRYIVLISVIVGLGIVMFFSIVFHSPNLIEPTIDIEGLESVSDYSVNVNDNGLAVIDGEEYEMYCKLDLRNKDIRELTIGEPIAYTLFNGHHYYVYYCPIESLPEGQWLASFKEDGSEGDITKKNGQYIWKRTDVDDVPEWLIKCHKRFIN